MAACLMKAIVPAEKKLPFLGRILSGIPSVRSLSREILHIKKV